MRLLRPLGLLAILVSAVALVQPGDAGAKQGQRGAPNGPAGLLFLRGSDGYRVQVVAVGHRVLLEATRGRVGATYAVRGKVSADRIDARFGKLGRIAVEFGSPDSPGLGRHQNSDGDRCAGGGSPLEFGVFHGTIKFRGEQGFITIDVKRAFGILIDFDAKPCPRRSGAGASAAFGRAPLNTQLTAVAKRKGAVTSFELSRRRGQSRILLKASRQERRGKMTIDRRASTVVGGDNAFLSSGPDVHPAFATVAAPKPFDGSALFAEEPSGSPSWTGSLAAWLPGAGEVALTGPDFALSFCRSAAEEPGCEPDPPVQRPR